MYIIFHTVDLCKGREYLMPWRTVLEVSKFFRYNGHEVVVFNSLHSEFKSENYSWQGINIYSFEMGFGNIITEINRFDPDVFVSSMTFRDGLKKSSLLEYIECRKIVYMSGGVYDFKSACYLGRNYGLKLAKPYIIESIVPPRLFINALKAYKVDSVVGLNDYTTETVVNAGFRSAHTIYPGKDDFEHIQPDNSIIERYGLSGKKWLLFTGAPAAYRGADLLVKAVDESSNDSIRLVMLMRTDVGSDYERFNHLLSSIKHPERIIVIKDKLSREQLRTFFGQAWYGVLPFIVIPSEIPLTYFEILSCGTPIISFENGGTSKYLKEALLIADKTINGLTRAIEHAWNDEHLKQRLSENGYKLMQNHPTWESVGKQWMDLIEKRK